MALSSRRGRKDASNCERARAFSGTDCDRVPRADLYGGKPCADQRLRAPSENHRPSTCHQGSVEDYTCHKFAAVGNSNGVAVPRSDQCFSNGFATVSRTILREPGRCLTATRGGPRDLDGTSRNGANPMTLLRQKIVFNLPRSPRQVSACIHGTVIDAAISRGSVSAAGVTRRFAPREREFMRQAVANVSATSSVAVATAMPNASAAAVSAFRRGLRVNESLTMRRNIVAGIFDK